MTAFPLEANTSLNPLPHEQSKDQSLHALFQQNLHRYIHIYIFLLNQKLDYPLKLVHSADKPLYEYLVNIRRSHPPTFFREQPRFHLIHIELVPTDSNHTYTGCPNQHCPYI